MTETGIETGIETGTGTGTEIEIEIETGTGTGIEPLTKLHAALRDGGDAPLPHLPRPTRGAPDALRVKGEKSCDQGNMVESVFQA